MRTQVRLAISSKPGSYGKNTTTSCLRTRHCLTIATRGVLSQAAGPLVRQFLQDNRDFSSVHRWCKCWLICEVPMRSCTAESWSNSFSQEKCGSICDCYSWIGLVH